MDNGSSKNIGLKGQESKKFIDFVKRHGQNQQMKSGSLFNHFQQKQIRAF